MHKSLLQIVFLPEFKLNLWTAVANFDSWIVYFVPAVISQRPNIKPNFLLIFSVYCAFHLCLTTRKPACLTPRPPLRSLDLRKILTLYPLLQRNTVARSILPLWMPSFFPRNQRTRWSMRAVSRPNRRVVITCRIDRVKWMIGATRRRSITSFHPMARWRARNRWRTPRARKSDPMNPI